MKPVLFVYSFYPEKVEGSFHVEEQVFTFDGTQGRTLLSIERSEKRMGA